MPVNNKIQHTKKALLEALEKSLGVVTSACKTVGVDRTTFYGYYNSDPEFKAAVDGIGEMALDFAETQLFQRIKGGDTTAMIFYLKTKGKKRGYVERQELTGPDGQAIEHRVKLDKNDLISDAID